MSNSFATRSAAAMSVTAVRRDEQRQFLLQHAPERVEVQIACRPLVLRSSAVTHVLAAPSRDRRAAGRRPSRACRGLALPCEAVLPERHGDHCHRRHDSLVHLVSARLHDHRLPGHERAGACPVCSVVTPCCGATRRAGRARCRRRWPAAPAASARRSPPASDRAAGSRARRARQRNARPGGPGSQPGHGADGILPERGRPPPGRRARSCRPCQPAPRHSRLPGQPWCARFPADTATCARTGEV